MACPEPPCRLFSPSMPLNASTSLERAHSTFEMQPHAKRHRPAGSSELSQLLHTGGVSILGLRNILKKVKSVPGGLDRVLQSRKALAKLNSERC